MSAQTAGQAELLAVEQQRCQAITEQDVDRLAGLLHEDLRHVHVTGTAQDKATYLAGLAGRPRTTSREELAVRVMGNVATMTGVQRNTRPGRPADRLQVLQVWVRESGRWQLLEFSSCGPIAAAS